MILDRAFWGSALALLSMEQIVPAAQPSTEQKRGNDSDSLMSKAALLSTGQSCPGVLLSTGRDRLFRRRDAYFLALHLCEH